MTLPPASYPQPSLADTLGVVRSVEGTTAQLVMHADGAKLPPLGTMVTIDTGEALAIAQVIGMHRPNVTGLDDDHPGLIDIELVGELTHKADGTPERFRRGVSVAPRLGDAAKTIEHDTLSAVSRHDSPNSIRLGYLHQDRTIPAFVETDEMLSKHFAIVGSTGTGKSCTVALILREVLAHHPHAHIVLLDPHDEYGTCFDDKAEYIPLDQLNLPYWCLTFEEFLEVVLGEASRQGDEAEVLRELIPQAKRKFAAERDDRSALRRAGAGGGGNRFSVDVPIPYRLNDVTGFIDEQMGKLDRPRDIDVYKRLKSRLQIVTQDPRFGFMFGGFAVQDSLKTLLQRIFRVPVQGKPITILGLKGLPGEIINVVVSVLARLAFDLAIYSKGRLPITFVCEEAHRYVPADTNQGFEPTKRSISRIAKEGRKYGASLCVVSQRPADLDPTILSQCSTVFAMRLSNERDQAIIASAMSDASRPLLKSLPLLGTREAVLFGEAVNLPSRIVLDSLPSDALPAGGQTAFSDHWSHGGDGNAVLDGIIRQWRFNANGGTEERSEDAVQRLHDYNEDQVRASGVESYQPDRPPGYGISYSGASGTGVPQVAQRPSVTPYPSVPTSGPSVAGAPVASTTTITPYPHTPYQPQASGAQGSAPDRRAVRGQARNSGFLSKYRT